jgi:drug/metabolite transporter (DMT)-like permease
MPAAGGILTASMSAPRKSLLPWVSLLVIYVVWGSTYLAIRVVVHEMPPLLAAALRFSTAGLIMGAVAFLVDRARPRPTRRQLLDHALVGVLLLSVGNGLVMSAERTIPSGIAALILATVPLWIVFVDGLRPGGQPWTLRVWLGTLVGLLGVALVARPEGAITREHWTGILALQAAALSWTVGSLYMQSRPQKLPLSTASATQMVAGSLALYLLALLMGEDPARVLGASRGAWGALLYLLVFGSLVGFTAFAHCLNELPAATVSTYAYVNPVVAVVLGALVLDEPLSPGLLAGGTLIVSSVVLTSVRRRAAS